MFIYLEANRFRKSWDVPLDELKQILDCDKVETYSAFKRFNKQDFEKSAKGNVRKDRVQIFLRACQKRAVCGGSLL
jgi:hypothetical protein